MSTTGGVPLVGSPTSALAGKGSPITTKSATQIATANAAAVATLVAAAGQYGFLTALILSIGHAAAAADFVATVTGLAGGTWSIVLTQGTVTGDQVFLSFDHPIPTSAVNTAIVATIPATGAAGAAIAATVVGFTY